MKTVIKAENINKSYIEESVRRDVLKEISLEIQRGEFVSVMGPSGSGKSTLLYCLSGMDRIDSGRILFQQKDISEYGTNQLADIRRLEMGFIFQQPSLLKNLNILDNIIVSSLVTQKKELYEVVEKARRLMKKTQIEDLADRDIRKVSGGQLQRAGICRALMNEPQILFGDEPTGALNSKAMREIMEIFQQLHEEGTTILMVTHDVKVAAYSEKVLFMTDGRIVSELYLGKCERKELSHSLILNTAEAADGSKYERKRILNRMEKITEKMRALSI